jgi:hypothetical protein
MLGNNCRANTRPVKRTDGHTPEADHAERERVRSPYSPSSLVRPSIAARVVASDVWP